MFSGITCIGQHPLRRREASIARIAALWGVGHTLAFLGIGLLVVLANVRVPPASARPVAIGLAHGLAGSAGIALLAATTIGSPSLAVTFLLLVAARTVFGMVSLTLLLSRPIGWTMRREGRLEQAAVLLASLLSIVLGTLVVARLAVGA